MQLQGGPHQGEVVDFSTVKNIMDYLSSTDKVAMMDYGFRDMGLQKMHMRDANGHNVTTVTLAEFRKINGAYEDALKDSGGSNTPAMRQALKELNALGERLYPASKAQKIPTQTTKLNLAKLKSDLVKFGLSPQKIDKLLKINNQEKLIPLEEMSQWLQGEVYGGRMTYEEASKITKRTAATIYTENLIPGGPTGDIVYRSSSPICSTTGFIKQRKYGDYIITNINIRTMGSKNSRIASTTSAAWLNYQNGKVFKRIPIIDAGIPVIHSRAVKDFWRHIDNELKLPASTTKVAAGLEGICYFEDGTSMNSTDKVLKIYNISNPQPHE